MKKILILVLCAVMVVSLGLVACAKTEAPPAATEEAPAPVEEAPAATEEAPAEEAPAAVEKKTIGFYADAADSYYQLLYDTLVACDAEDDTTDFTVDFKVGQSTADEQLKAVEDFITAGYDAIAVIQNNPNTTSECITKATEAKIPYFGMTHSFASIANKTDAAGAICYDFIQAGKYAGEDALKRGVTKVIMIEGVLGQGSAGAQSQGFLMAYEEAGKSLGGVTAEELATKKTEVKLDGTQELEVVFWGSGNWFAEAAQKTMTDAITSLGKDGWDGAYVQNNPMVEGAIAAIKEAGLQPADYWLGSSNGREISWDWAKNKEITMDVNQPGALEGCMLFQQLKAYFAGEEYRKYIHPYLTPYNIDDIAELEPSLVPCSDVKAFMDKKASGAFVTDINDPKFVDQAGF